MTLLIVLSMVVLAQEPATADTRPAAPPVIEEIAPTAWLVEDSKLLRWPDAEAEVTSLPAGTEVEVILREGDKARVRKDLDFGWVPQSAVSDQPPAAE